jgi:hypothetical protein
MYILRRDAAEVCRSAATILMDPASGGRLGPEYQLGVRLQQIAIALGDSPVHYVHVPGGTPPREPNPAPLTEEEAGHCLRGADALDRGEHATAVRHIVEAAAHRVMSQVIGAIEKVNADRATPTGEASASQRGDRHRGRAGGRGKRPRAQKGARKAGRR